MRSQNITDLLRYEAKRQPELAAIVQNIHHMSDEQIKATKVKLPWMRQALLQLKHEMPSAELVSAVLAGVVSSSVPDPMGEMRKWTGPNTFIRIGKSHLEITTGQLIWFDKTGLWIDTIHTTVIDPLLSTNTKSCGPYTRLGYMEAIRSRIGGKTVPVSATVNSHNGRAFQIYRP